MLVFYEGRTEWRGRGEANTETFTPKAWPEGWRKSAPTFRRRRSTILPFRQICLIGPPWSAPGSSRSSTKRLANDRATARQLPEKRFRQICLKRTGSLARPATRPPRQSMSHPDLSRRPASSSGMVCPSWRSSLNKGWFRFMPPRPSLIYPGLNRKSSSRKVRKQSYFSFH
jgi:hypothetical protein